MPWYLYALITAVAIALVGLLQKKTLQNEHSAEYFMVFSLIKVGIFFLFTQSRIHWAVSGGQFLLLGLTGIFAGLAFFFVSKALRRQDLSVVAPILSLDSGLGSLIALVVLHETLTGRQFFGLFLLVLGTYVLEMHRQIAGPNQPRKWLRRLVEPWRSLWRTPGGVFALLSMSCFAISGVVDRAVLQHVTTTTYLAYVLPTIALVSIILFISTKSRLEILRSGSHIMILPIVLTAGLHLVSNVTQAQATGLMAIGLVLALKRLSTLIDVLVSGKFLHEHGIAQKAFASVIILFGVFLVVT